MRKKYLGKWADDFTKWQGEYSSEIESLSKQMQSQPDEAVDYRETGIPESRKAMITDLVERTSLVQIFTRQYPWWLLAAGFLAPGLSSWESGLAVSPSNILVMSAIFSVVLTPFYDGASRIVQVKDSIRAKERLARMLERVKSSLNRAVAVSDFFSWTDVSLKNDSDVRTIMQDRPLVIASVGVGGSTGLDRDNPIEIPQGKIAVIKGRIGSGKSTFLRSITLSQGNIEQILVSRGIDLRKIPTKTLRRVVRLVEAINPQHDLTFAQLMGSYLILDEDNEFRNKVIEVGVRFGEVGCKIAEALANERETKTEWLAHWINKPMVNENDSEDITAAKNILSTAFFELIQGWIPNITNVETANEYLMRTPGESRGSSTGEGKVFELFRSLLTKPTILAWDEPTANLDSQTKKAVVEKLIQFVNENPLTIVLIASHDAGLVRRLVNQAPDLMGPIIEKKRSKRWGVRQEQISEGD